MIHLDQPGTTVQGTDVLDSFICTLSLMLSHTCARTRTHARTCTHTHTHAHAHPHANTHTHTRTQHDHSGLSLREKSLLLTRMMMYYEKRFPEDMELLAQFLDIVLFVYK